MWFFFALAAAILWGLQYTLFGQHFRSGNMITFAGVYSLATAILSLIINLSQGTAIPSYTPTQWASLAIQVACGLMASLCTAWAIQQKNATLASFVEICYPVFIVLFSFLLYQQIQLTPKQTIGAGLIIAGLFFISH